MQTIEFTLRVVVRESEDREGRYDPVFSKKKDSWPTLPRKGESYQLPDKNVDGCHTVTDVWHWRHDDGSPNIYVELEVTLSDYKKLVESPDWIDYGP